VHHYHYRPGAVCRGLVVDKLHGYLLKIDRNKYIKKGMLGFDALDAQTRKTTYNKEVVSFSEDNFVNIDSTSLLVGKCRHSSNTDFQVIGHALMCMQRRCCSRTWWTCASATRCCSTCPTKRYTGTFAAGRLLLLRGVTTAVGCCSDVRDAMTGSLEGPIIKQTVLADPGHCLHYSMLALGSNTKPRLVVRCCSAGKYIKHDYQLVPTLQQLRRSGKKTFLLTNSLWDYANGVMKYLLEDTRSLANNCAIALV
jgi:hypothetical protein